MAIQAIVESDFQVPADGNLENLTTQLIGHLSSVDADARENSTEILWQWGMRGTYSDAQLLSLGDQMSANLVVGLGDTATDTVFLRAFSALLLGMVVMVDQRCALGLLAGRPSFLPQKKALEWYDQALRALDGEKDYRGFVERAGWAHAIAHMADALRDFARSQHLDAAQLERMLNAIADKITQPCDVVCLFDEDNRIVQAVMVLLRRDEVSAAFLSQWLNSLALTPDGGHWGDVFSMGVCNERLNKARMNTRSFLRSLYFQLLIGSRSYLSPLFPEFYDRPIPHREELMEGIVETLKKMDKYYYVREE